MNKVDRFIISSDYHDKRFINETGAVLSWNEDRYYTNEVMFDDPDVQFTYEVEGAIQFEAIDLIPSLQTNNRDIEFENKMKDSLISLFERGIIEITTQLEEIYNGKVIGTKVFINKKEVFYKGNSVNIKF